MKILTTISYYKPHISGLTVCAQRLIEGLSKKGFEFMILTSRYDKSLPKVERREKVSILRRPMIFTLGKVPVMPGYLLTLIKEMRRVDLVWIHLPQAEGLMAVLAAKLFGKKTVATVHCLPLLPFGWQRFLFQRIFDLINNSVIFLADEVVYYTKDYAENTKELWHFPEKSSYILPPIPDEGRRKKEETRRKRNGLTIGFAGRVAEDKGVEYLIKAVQLMKVNGRDVRLIMAGSRDALGEGRYSKKIYSLIDESGLDVEFLGLIDPEKMGSFYRLIDILVLPSVNRTEAFGMVQAEAMKYGVPVVASDLPGVKVPLMLIRGSGELVSASNAWELAEAILRIFTSAAIDKESIARDSEKQFSIEGTINRYAGLLSRLWRAS